MKVIGLCGGSGSGKGAVSDIFSRFDIPAIDADTVYRELTSSSSPCLSEIVSYFGEGVLNASGGLDRKTLAQIVFSDTEKLKYLNAITHKHVLAKIRDYVSDYDKSGKKAVVVDAPLLFESGFDKECDLIIAVIAERETRIRRIIERDSITREQALRRIDSQLSEQFLCGKANYVLSNNGSINELYEQTARIIKKILNCQ